MEMLPLNFKRWWRQLTRQEQRGEFVVDMFAGGGGTSVGIEAAIGRPVDIAINHDPDAIAIHRANHPKTYHFLTDVREVDPRKVLPTLPCGFLWLSPDCTHHSKAKGGKPVKRNRRALANVGTVWAAARKPRVIILENVEEFEDWGPLKDNQPDKTRRGQCFKAYCTRLRNMGYDVEHKILVAADYGAPTTRKRLFLVARRDGLPIVWPNPSHAKRAQAQQLGLKTWVAASTVIDWDLPARSIFGRKFPLAEATQKRIFKGLQRYVFNSADPFIVMCNHGGDHAASRSVHDPMRTLTASQDAHGLVQPYLVSAAHTKTTGHGKHHWPLDEPLRTIYGTQSHAVILPHLSHFYGAHGEEVRASSVKTPLPTVTADPRFGMVNAWLLKQNAGSHSGSVQEPLPTLMTSGHDALMAAHLTKFYSTNIGQDPRDPLQTITGSGQHIGEVRAFLVKYFGTGGQWGSLKDPAPTVTSKDRLGLVTVAGQEYQIVDISLRMLAPKELLGAQFGRFAKGYKMLGSNEKQVKAIGNSVPPEVAEALVKANYSPDTEASLEAVA